MSTTTSTLNSLDSIKILKLAPEVQTPAYETSGSAGFDLRAFIPEEQEIILKANGDRAKVPTGLKMVLPAGFELQIRPRSGLAFKHGISLTNTPGTIDNDYRGELQILIINHGENDYKIKHQDRIAQGVLAPIYQTNFETIAELPSETDNLRGEGGFGSTGTA
jgi:dUTP pyrophosphatase